MDRKEARRKAELLVGQMTLEERASQLRYDAPPIPRLSIPAYNWWNEALHGVARAGQATMFPQAIGMAATFDAGLLEEIGDAVAVEGRAKYNMYSRSDDRGRYKGLTFWAPNINIFRDPRWGRGHETYGEDPYLTGRLGVAFVKGLQGDGGTLKAAACAKHFAVHSGPEALRHEFDAKASKKDLYETYLPAFEMLVKEAKVEAVMGAYNRTNGEPCCGSKTLITDILRGEWGFEGHVVSDCWAIRDFHENHMVTRTPRESAAMAINAGCDLNCGVTYLHILNAYEDGLVSGETITEAAVRVFTTRYLLGVFDGSEYDTIPYEKVECREHLALSQKAAEESFVLLKNNGILPLKKGAQKAVGIIGPNADSRAALTGNYHGTASFYVTVQEGLQQYLGDETRVLTSVGCDLFEVKKPKNLFAEARTVTEHSDVVVLCLGLDETLEGEQGDTGNSHASGDKEDLLLPKPQRELMETVAQAAKEHHVPVILCLMAGSDIDLSYAAEHFDAILMLWYPGSCGGHAAARMLYGEVSPSGKLPVTFYESLEELPDFTDYGMRGRTYRYMEHPAQYPFGYGLTYGKARITDAQITVTEQQETDKGQETNGAQETGAVLCARIMNEGNCDIKEVIEVYVKKEDSAYDTLHPSLCAFARVELKRGETKEIQVEISKNAFTVVDDDGNRFVDGTHFRFYVGFSQPDERSVELMGARPLEIEVEL